MKKNLITIFSFLLFTGFSYSFTLSEISFDWTNERIEFSVPEWLSITWSLFISWAKSSSFVRDINTFNTNSILLVDNSQWFNYWNTCWVIDWVWLSLSDTKEIHIERKLEWTQYSWSVLVPKDKVNFVNNSWDSFIFSWGNFFQSAPSFCTSNNVLHETPVEEIEQWLLQISEIHPYNDLFPEYIEIECISLSCEWNYVILGLWHWSSSKEITLNISKWDRVVLSKDSAFWKLLGHHKAIQGLSLTDWWEEIIISGQSGQLIDSAVYSWSKDDWKSFYRVSNWYFTLRDISSPWFHQSLFSSSEAQWENVTDCWIRIQNWSAFYAKHKVNLITNISWKDIQNSSKKYSCVWFSENALWELEGCNPWYIWFWTWWIHEVTLSVETNWLPFCKTSTSINLPILNKLDTPIVEKEVIAKISSNTNSSQENPHEIIIQEPLWIKIIWALPNPKWKDTGKEIIFIKNTTSERINKTDVSLTINWKKKNIPKIIIEPFWSAEIIGSLGLTNNWWCISLIDKNEFCYMYPWEGEVVKENYKILWKNSVDILRSVTLRKQKDERCVFYKKNSVFCKESSYLKETVDNRKKDSKKLETVTKKYEKLKKTSNKTTIKVINSKVELLGKETIYFMNELLRDYPIVYDQSWFKDVYNDWRKLTYSAKKGDHLFAYWWTTGSIEDIRNYYSLTRWGIELEEQSLWDYAKALYIWSKELLDDYLY